MKYYHFDNQSPLEACSIEKTLVDKKEDYFFTMTVGKGVFIGVDIPYTTFNDKNTDGVGIIRYAGTGGPVFFSGGEVKTGIYIENGTEEDFQNCKNWVVKSLQDLGIDASSKSEGNDIYVEGKKVSGVMYREFGTKSFLGFFFSFEIDFDTASRVMFLQKHTTDLRERALGLNQMKNSPQVTAEQVIGSLKTNYPTFWSRDSRIIPSTFNKKDPLYEASLQQFTDEDWIKYSELNSKYGAVWKE